MSESWCSDKYDEHFLRKPTNRCTIQCPEYIPFYRYTTYIVIHSVNIT